MKGLTYALQAVGIILAIGALWLAWLSWQDRSPIGVAISLVSACICFVMVFIQYGLRRNMKENKREY